MRPSSPLSPSSPHTHCPTKHAGGDVGVRIEGPGTEAQAEKLLCRRAPGDTLPSRSWGEGLAAPLHNGTETS